MAVVLAAVLVGGLWFFGTAPAPAPPLSAAPAQAAETAETAEQSAMSSVLVLQMGDGTVVVDENGLSTLYHGMRQPDTRPRLLLGGPPCRIGGRGSILEDLGVGDAGRLPRCHRPRR